ncbi:MAG: septal ring lytic transglycosylase RlpA family protein [Cyanobacteria bacterium P01_C01_bin.118]
MSTINKIATLSAPKVSSALLNAAAVLPQPVSVISDITGIEDVHSSTSYSTVAKATFQSLEPLNLSDVANSLEQIFEISLESQNFSAALNSKNISSSASVSTPVTAGAKAPQADTSHHSLTVIEAKPIATEPKKAAPVVLRGELDQCIDAPRGNIDGNTKFQVIRQGTIIGKVNSSQGAEHVLRSLQAMIAPNQLDPNAISPVLNGEQSSIRLSSDLLLHVTNQAKPDKVAVDKAAADTADLSDQWAAIMWSDQLRRDLGAAPLDAGDVQVMLKDLQISDQNLGGLASWYGPYFHGRLTANGEVFDQDVLTAAHKSLPFNTVLQVRNLKNNRSVVVRINDRGPYIGKRSLDLSKAAALCLDSEQTGVIPYEAVILEQPVDVDDAN